MFDPNNRYYVHGDTTAWNLYFAMTDTSRSSVVLNRRVDNSHNVYDALDYALVEFNLSQDS